MSIFFELPMNLRERWWSANTLEEREAVEVEYHLGLKALYLDGLKALYLEALEVIRIPAWPDLETKLSGPDSHRVAESLRSYLAALRVEREAWKVFAKGGPHSELQKTHKLCWNTLDELRAVLSD